MRIRATDAVAERVCQKGGRIYVWTSAHRCCSGSLTLLEAATERPRGAERQFRELDAGDFRLLLDMGGLRLPEELVLEFRGRRRKIAAYWNDQAWVG
jgi:hypothetical protein